MCIVVLVPESGDEIQMMKAGLIEIADLFVINKSDRDGANRLSSILKNIIHNFTKIGKLEPPVFNTIATERIGVSELFKGMESHMELMLETGHLERRRLDRYRQRVMSQVREKLEQGFWTSFKLQDLKEMTAKIDELDIVPHMMANRLMDQTK